MNQERDQARTHIAPSAPTHDDDLAPGRGSRSSRLDAPSHPIAGGLIQRRARDANGVAESADTAVASAASSSGSPLPETLMRKFESSLGADLSGVRIHTAGTSEHAADAVGARAYTMGNDIHFAAGHYDPSSTGGQHLLAHEVAHTIQQAGGGAPARQAKLEVSAPGDAFEIEADRAADAMVAGSPATIGRTSATRMARQPQEGAVGAGGDAKTAPTPEWVDFSKTGEWDGRLVLDTLATQVTVPIDMQAAILGGAKGTALFCIDLRKRVNVAAADPAKQAECELIINALTSRITELTYATSRSPLKYRQLVDVARWAGQFPSAGGMKTDKEAKGDEAKGDETDSDEQSKAIEEYATRLAAQAGGRVREGDKDQARQPGTAANDVHTGEESGSAELAGYTLIRDPFDNTVTAIRPDGTGIQYTYQVEKTDEGPPKVQLVHAEELTKLRVQALKRMDKAGLGEAQEKADGPQRRMKADHEVGEKARADWAKKYPAEFAAYQALLNKYQSDLAALPPGAKKPPPPPPPDHYPADKKVTMCTALPGEVFYSAGGRSKQKFDFTPPTTFPSWRTLATNPEGPRPGDIYYLWDTQKNQAAHMGVFKSASPVTGQEDLQTWVVTDGGQGSYEGIQQVNERTRGPFNRKTGIFSSSIAEAGQSKGDRKLVGWIDIDAHHAANPVSV